MSSVLSKQRFYWMARRGMLELDVLFNRFIDNHYDHLSPQELEAFGELLAQQDPILFSWFFTDAKPEQQEWLMLINAIKANYGLKADQGDRS